VTASTTIARPKSSKPAMRVVAVRFLQVPRVKMESVLVLGRDQLPRVAQTLRLNIGELEDPNLHVRAFARDAGKAIDQKYVYVWRAQDARGTGLKLMHELWFEEGEFQHVSFDGKQGGRGKDVRKASGPRHTVLPLVVGSFEVPAYWYFFLLSPVQYPWAALERIAPEMPARGMRFPDPFWADLLLTEPRPEDGSGPGGGRARGAPSGPATACDLPKAREWRAKGAAIVGAQVYLVDPLAEGEERARTYARALDAWYAEIKRLDGDSNYVLAKRIAAVVSGQPKLKNEIREPELYRYIEESERELERTERAKGIAAHELLEWIGCEMRFDPRGPVLLIEGKSAKEPPAASEARFNLFSQMVRDLAGEQVPAPVARAVTAVHERLGESGAGRNLIWHLSQARESGKTLVADGGLSILYDVKVAPAGASGATTALPGAEAAAGGAEQERLEDDLREAVRKSGGTAKEVAALLCESLAPHWEEAHLRRVFRQFGIELERVPPKASRVTRLAEAERITAEAREVLREADIGVRLRPRNAEALRALGKVAPFLQLGLELNNTARALSAMGEGRLGAKEAISLAGTVTDALAAANDVARLIRPASAGLARAAPILGIVSGAIDTGTGVMDMSAEYEKGGWSGRTAGHGLRTTGGVLAVVGGVLLIANPVGLAGALVVLVGIAAQGVGSWVVEASSEMRECLRGSPWGKQRAAALLIDVAGARSQHRALSRAIYPFTARMVADSSGSRFSQGHKRLVFRAEVDEKAARWVPVNAQWTVEAEGMFGSSLTWKGWGLPKRSAQPRVIDGALVVEAEVPGVVIGSKDDFVKVSSAVITLAPCPDQRHWVEKLITQDEFDPSPLFGAGDSRVAR
jgi:hypothetical protein